MSSEFIKKFELSYKASPSMSCADNILVDQLISTALNQGGIIDDLPARCLLAWQTKKLARHLISDDSQVVPDTVSARWSPGYYRIDSGLAKLRDEMKGASILDPFSGSGSIMHSLLALDIPSQVFLNDLSYRGGTSIWRDDRGIGYYYYPEENLSEYRSLFNEYQDHVPPVGFDRIAGYGSEDVGRGLSHQTNSFDLVFTDPPYGKNLSSSGINGLLEYLPEMLRVARECVILMIPEAWLTFLANLPKYNVEDLSDCSGHQHSSFSTKLVRIYK